MIIQWIYIQNWSNNLKEEKKTYIDSLLKRYPILKCCENDINNGYITMKNSFENSRKLLIAGNGGSAADSEHIAGELMKRFQLPRPISSELADRLVKVDLDMGEYLAERLEKTLTAIPLVAHEALTTAYSNDVDGNCVFAQQLLGYGKPGDVFLAISTSGNSTNILNAAVVAKAMDIKVIALTGNSGGKLANFADVAVVVPEIETYKIQELHLPIYHCWCNMLETHFFG